jgi:hypothetical protein
MTWTRRGLVRSVAAAGTLGAVCGAGTSALLTDEFVAGSETAPNEVRVAEWSVELATTASTLTLAARSGAEADVDAGAAAALDDAEDAAPPQMYFDVVGENGERATPCRIDLGAATASIGLRIEGAPPALAEALHLQVGSATDPAIPETPVAAFADGRRVLECVTGSLILPLVWRLDTDPPPDGEYGLELTLTATRC